MPRAKPERDTFFSPPSMPIPILTVREMRAWEQATWDSGQTPQAVIHQVGQRLARRILALDPPPRRVLVLAGKGHNGDDARATAAALGPDVARTLTVHAPAAALVDLQAQLQTTPELIVDGLFGIGLNRPLDASWQPLLDRIHAAQVPILSIDVPSGLELESGSVNGPAVRATTTVTLGAVKSGLLAPGAIEHVGRLCVEADIGLLSPAPPAERLLDTAADFRDFWPHRPIASHKGHHGHLGIVAGSSGYHGAAVLAARGAARARPGLITLLTSADVYTPVAAQLQAAMVRPWSIPPELQPSAWLLGPGLAHPAAEQDLREFTTQLWRQAPVPVIVDASALGWLPHAPVSTDACRVVTPHPGEAARLLGLTTAQVQADRSAALRWLSSTLGHCWVVLKGHQTLVGRSSGLIHVNASGNAELAQGGAGDILAGFIAGLLAQPALRQLRAPDRILRFATWCHGAAADTLSLANPAWTIEELADCLGSTDLGHSPLRRALAVL